MLPKCYISAGIFNRSAAMRKCEECGKQSVEFAFDTGQKEVWECRFCGARYHYDSEFGELQRFTES